MKKRISLILCVLASMLIFTACGKAKETMEYDPAYIEQASEILIEYCQTNDEMMLKELESMTDFQMEYQLLQAGLPYTPESFMNAIQGWPAAIEECGEYISHGDYVIEAEDGEITAVTQAEFSERSAELTFIYDENSRLTSMTVNAKLSTGEILEKAGLNTVLGMGTVFVVLIFISIIISLFKFIPAIERAFKKKSQEEIVKEAAPVAERGIGAGVAMAADTDDTELIAVISAAIAAAEGTTTDGFVVRGIRRRPSNKWNS